MLRHFDATVAYIHICRESTGSALCTGFAPCCVRDNAIDMLWDFFLLIDRIAEVGSLLMNSARFWWKKPNYSPFQESFTDLLVYIFTKYISRWWHLGGENRTDGICTFTSALINGEGIFFCCFFVLNKPNFRLSLIQQFNFENVLNLWGILNWGFDAE